LYISMMIRTILNISGGRECSYLYHKNCLLYRGLLAKKVISGKSSVVPRSPVNLFKKKGILFFVFCF